VDQGLKRKLRAGLHAHCLTVRGTPGECYYNLLVCCH